jgi:coatomer subunit beta'
LQLGYLAKHNRVYACDKDLAVCSYRLPLAVLDYQTAVMRRDWDGADPLLAHIPTDQHTRIAQFLEKQVSALQTYF